MGSESITIIKDNRYDTIIERFLGVVYFIHQFTFILSASAMSRGIDSLNKSLNMLMIVTFAIIMLADFYYFLRGKFSIKEIIIYIIITIPLLISFYHYRVVMVLANVFLISCFKNVDVKRMIKIYLLATALGCVCNLLISLFTPWDGNVVQSRYGIERIRYGLGFFYTTFLPHYFYSIVFMYILYNERLRKIDYFLAIIINILLFIATDTKAVLIYVFLILVITLILNKSYNEIIHNVFGIITTLSFIFCGLIAFSLSYFYDGNNKIMLYMNQVLSGRLELMHRGLVRWGITLWGQKLPIEETGNTIDSSMVSMLMQNGVVVYIICIGFMTYLAYLSHKKKYLPLQIALFAIAIRSAFDLGFMSLQFGPAVVLLYTVLENNVIKKEINLK